MNALAYITGNHHISFNSAVLCLVTLFVFLREKKKKKAGQTFHASQETFHACPGLGN